MKSSDLTPAQADAIRETIRPTLVYLGSLQRRMEQRSFPPGDALYQQVIATRQELNDLFMRLHYLSCPGSVGRRD